MYEFEGDGRTINTFDNDTGGVFGIPVDPRDGNYYRLSASGSMIFTQGKVMSTNHHRGHHQDTGDRESAPRPQGERRHHQSHGDHGLNKMAASATLHCLTGCAIGEILGLIIGTAFGLLNGWTIGIAIALAFLFGYSLSTLPLLKAGLSFVVALRVVLAADTLSIATMEVVDNAVMAVIPGAMNAGLVNYIFWVGMMIAMTAAFFAASERGDRYNDRHLVPRRAGLW